MQLKIDMKSWTHDQAFSQDSECGRPISGAAMPFVLGRGEPQGEGD